MITTQYEDELDLASPAGNQLEQSAPQADAMPPTRAPQILIVSPVSEDHTILARMLNGVCRIHDVETCHEALSFLCYDRVPVIVCERDLPDGSWRDMLSHVADMIEPPSLIVTSRLADEYLWSEVLNQGGCDVLAKPFSETEVRYVLGIALGQKAGGGRKVLVAGASAF